MKLIPTGKSRIELLRQIPDSMELQKGRLPSGAQRDVYERVVGKERPGEPNLKGPYQRAQDLIMSFDVYNPKEVRTVIDRTPIEAGDTIGLEVPCFPGLSLFFGCRVVDCFNECANGRYRVGFTYHTLQGHPVLGEESFSVEKDVKSGMVRLTMRSWSMPGMVLTTLMGPLLHSMQKNVAKSAMDYMESKIAT